MDTNSIEAGQVFYAWTVALLDNAVRHKLHRMRNQRLAHRDMRVAAATGPSATDQEIQAFYRDNSEIVRLLLSIVNGLAYNPAEAGEVSSAAMRPTFGLECGESKLRVTRIIVREKCRQQSRSGLGTTLGYLRPRDRRSPGPSAPQGA